MWRTYKSKKESGLDPRDVKEIVDAKCSVFDAFYIENLKQAKRELSCLGVSKQYSTSHRIRKKKYVKRLKEPEILRERESSHSQSTYLTPDKSLRVNKAEDLFDKLLRSSPPLDSTVDTKISVNKNKRKSYTKRKRTNVKKINYSSSGSDKENSSNNSLEQSDIKSHILVIEKEVYNKSDSLNDSIEKIDKNVSLFSNLQKQNEEQTPNKKEIRISALGGSPLCSTPFFDKYRGKSIYKFSPILINRKTINPSQSTDVSMNAVSPPSKLINRTKSSLGNANQLLTINKDASMPDDCMTNDVKESYNDRNGTPHCNNSTVQTVNFDMTQGDITDVSGNQDISIILQCTEKEKFLGFSKSEGTSKIEKLKQLHDKMLENCSMTYTDTDISCEPVVETRKAESRRKVKIDTSCSSQSVDSSENSVKETESLYDTCSENELGESQDFVQKEPVVVIERLRTSILMKYLNERDSSIDQIDSSNGSTENYTSFDSNTCNISFNNSEISEKSASCSSESHLLENQGISFVTTRRRNEKTNDSFIFSLDNSTNSVSSLDVDKTIVNNNGKHSIDCTLVNIEDKNEDITSNRKSKKETIVFNINEVEAPKNVRQSNSFDHQSNSITCRNKRSLRPSRNLRESSIGNNSSIDSKILNQSDIKHPIVLQPGKKWERSLSIYRRMTTMVDGMDCSLLDIESLENKGRKYRQSVIATMEMQDLNASLNNESIKSRRSTFVSKPVRSTVKLDSNASRASICSSAVIEDLQGFLTEDCDDTVVDLSKLSLGDSEVEVTILENFHETSIRSSSARDYVLRRCNQTDAILFDECYPDTALKNCHKIGEGVYGEVFLWRAGDGQARVLKVIPVAGDVLVNGEHQKDYGQIISEIVIAMELSALGAPIPDIEKHLNEGKDVEALDLHSVENATDVFNKVLAVRLVYGSYPSRLLDLWELYDECKGSENDNPAILPQDQHFIVLELANAGQDLESYQFHNAEQAYSLFKQVAFALAAAEEAYQFEHRDLHWGNVLIAPTDQKYATFVVRGRAWRVPTRGVRGTLIDYSLSRVTLRGAALHCDLAADDALFDALGDYQFDVYRLMRARLRNDWKNYDPYTNILWLHYTADKMITALRYTRTNTKVHRHYIAKLKDVKNRILNYGSATEYILTDNEI